MWTRCDFQPHPVFDRSAFQPVYWKQAMTDSSTSLSSKSTTAGGPTRSNPPVLGFFSHKHAWSDIWSRNQNMWEKSWKRPIYLSPQPSWRVENKLQFLHYHTAIARSSDKPIWTVIFPTLHLDDGRLVILLIPQKYKGTSLLLILKSTISLWRPIKEQKHTILTFFQHGYVKLWGK